MAALNTSYMGLSLTSPIIVGASNLSKKVDNIKKAEEAGAGALVINSLFQEQIERESADLHDELLIGSERFPEALSYFPQLDYSDSREHMMWIEKARKEVSMPLIGSLNAVSVGSWIKYAKEFENAGCNALELNLFNLETAIHKLPSDIEYYQLEIIEAVVSEVKIPVAVKLGPWYTSISYFSNRAVKAGAKGLVFFNRFYQPIIDPCKEEFSLNLELSSPEDTRLPLRWIGLLSGELQIDIAASSGVYSAKEASMHLLAGAKAVQCVSTLFINGIEYIAEINKELSCWMDEKGYSSISDFNGKLSQSKVKDSQGFIRAQYASVLNEFKGREIDWMEDAGKMLDTDPKYRESNFND